MICLFCYVYLDIKPDRFPLSSREARLAGNCLVAALAYKLPGKVLNLAYTGIVDHVIDVLAITFG